MLIDMESENELHDFLSSDRFSDEAEESLEIHKSMDEKPVVVDWTRQELPLTDRFLAGDFKVYGLLQKALREKSPIYEADFGGKQHLKTHVVFHDKKALFLKQAPQKQAEREGFVYQLASLAGLSRYMEPTCSAKMGDNYYSCSLMMDKSFKSFTSWSKFNPDALNGIIEKAKNEGISHKIAFFDLVISNLDRHRGNVFTNGAEIRVIDHGRSFTPWGRAFVPAVLRNSENEILKSVSDSTERDIRMWLGGLKSDSRLFVFRGAIDKLDFSWDKSICKQIADAWEGKINANNSKRPK